MEETPSEISKDGNQLTTFSNDNLVEVDSQKLFKSSTYYKKLSILLGILAILFFILMVIFIILNVRNKPISDPEKSKMCTSKECLRTASNYRSAMNDSAEPCDNFYEFACGKWSEQHPNHGWRTSLSSLASIFEQIVIASMNILSKEIDIDNDPDAVKKSKNFYKSCLDTETLDKLGVAVMYPFLEKMNLPIVPSFITVGNKSDIKFNWMLTNALAKQILNINIFIPVNIFQNKFNGSHNSLLITYYIYQSNNETVNNNIIKYVMNEIILNATGQEATDDVLKEAADVILEMADFINEILANITDLYDEKEEPFAITVENLQNEINRYIKKPNPNLLATYLEYLFNGTDVTVNTKSDPIYVAKSSLLLLNMIMDYLMGLPDINIELYAWWTVVFEMATYTSTDISDYIKKHSLSDNSKSVAISKSFECTTTVNYNMFYAVSYMLADPLFENVTKPKVTNMMLDIKQAFLTNVKKLTWIDATTKNAIFEKAEETITSVGYPNWLFEKGKLDKYYENIIIKPDTYLENILNVKTSNAKMELNSLRKIVKRDEWDGNPVVPNAHHVHQKNKVDILMAILNFPAYNLGLEALHYAAIGAVLGHEFIHGFDNNGRKYNKYGNFQQWWTNETIENFETLTDCFVKQYGNFTIPGLKEHINGKKNLGEILADNGGLNQAFTAYQNYISQHGEELKLPSFENYSNDQLFFIAFANTWCETTNAKDLKKSLVIDVHPPPFVRVLGTLQNSEDFANAFNCPKGSFMNPMERCKIW